MKWSVKIGQPVLNLLKQGISPEKMSLCIAFGAVIGILPILGATTLICSAIAIALRLNLPAIQLFNYLVYPLQILLLIPFVSLGAFIFQVDLPPLTVQGLSALFQQDFWGSIASFFETVLYAVVAWLIVCTPLFVGIYSILIAVLKGSGQQPEIACLSDHISPLMPKSVLSVTFAHQPFTRKKS